MKSHASIRVIVIKGSQQTVAKESMNARKQKNNLVFETTGFLKDLFFEKTSTFEIQREKNKKYFAIKLFEFQEKFMIGTFFIKLTQFE